MMSRKVDINSAGVDELSTLLGVGRTRAEAIVQRRETHGAFHNIQELTSVQGIGSNVVDSNRNRLQCHSRSLERLQQSSSSHLRHSTHSATSSSSSSSSSASSAASSAPSSSLSSSSSSSSSSSQSQPTNSSGGHLPILRSSRHSQSASSACPGQQQPSADNVAVSSRRRSTRQGTSLEAKNESDSGMHAVNGPGSGVTPRALGKVLRSGSITASGDGEHSSSESRLVSQIALLMKSQTSFNRLCSLQVHVYGDFLHSKYWYKVE
ncbi:uncharacterized protein [Diadema antillarum]|uniref:uncharacterized protein n=1 Tax=Diadema antillarum TaxID=105358 RepID=UPI003A889504